METLNYSDLYGIVKYQYDKVKKERESNMSEEERNRRAQLDSLADLYNNPNLSNMSSLANEYLFKKKEKEKEKDDPNSYVYYSKNYI